MTTEVGSGWQTIPGKKGKKNKSQGNKNDTSGSVSYTHLTLPTIYSV